ncbi:MAG TPA: thiosulfate oxidation carrier protein SoxY [Burkholderiales bacterium]|nr:thiosulfate oxidation carrier protein SoxY [Burkholderiales bacterium]
MQTIRRDLLKAGGALAVAAAFGGALLRPGSARAAWNQAAFQAKNAADAMRALGMHDAAESKDIEIRAPDIAENGAVVPVDITSSIPGTTSISVFIEKNPFPYTGTFDFAAGTMPYVHLRAKLGESTPVRVVVAANGKFYTTAKEVKVTIGGCGG